MRDALVIADLLLRMWLTKFWPQYKEVKFSQVVEKRKNYSQRS